MKVFQSRSFEHTVKQLTKGQKQKLDRQIQRIMKNPKIGVEKKGDLGGIFIHKFKVHTDQFLLAYRMTNGDIQLIMLGPHENYYRNLKKYVKD